MVINKKFQLFSSALVLMFFIFFDVSAQSYVREYTYKASEADSKISSRSIALDQVKLLLLQEIGVHIRQKISIEKKSDGGVYADEDIEALTAGFSSVDILEEKWNGVTYYLKAKIDVNTNDVLNALKKFKNESNQHRQQLDELEQNHLNDLKDKQKELKDVRKELQLIKQELATVLTFQQKTNLVERYDKNITILTNAEIMRKALVSYEKAEYDDAFYWANKAADLGDSSAQYMLGALYMSGKGTKHNYKKALSLLKQSAGNGETSAQVALAEYYSFGVSLVPPDIDFSDPNFTEKIAKLKADPQKAVDLYRQAAEKGEAKAILGLGGMYMSGLGVIKDKKKGLALYRKAADKGSMKAPFYLSRFSESNDELIYWLKRSAENGYSHASYTLGIEYFQGEAVKRDIKEAISWFKKAANQGNIGAAEVLGLLYSQAKWDLLDYGKAEYWFVKTAVNGKADEQYFLATRFYLGDGLQKDFTKAVYWYEKSAEQGLYDAQIALADMYEKGDAVKQDSKKATYWKQRSEMSKNNMAIKTVTRFLRDNFYTTTE